MSIPPLVCSTPPPPEQCEDDKEPDYFDINYNLSQEDDSGEYDYGNFSSFTHFQSSTSECPGEREPQRKNSEHTNYDEVKLDQVHVIKEDNRVETSEDDVIEDLDLTIDHEPGPGISKNGKDSEVNFKEHSIKGLNPDIPLNSANTQDELKLNKSDTETTSLDCNVNTEMLVKNNDDSESNSCTEDTTEITHPYLNNDIAADNVTKIPQELENNIATLPQDFENNLVQEKNTNENLEDFEDFDDFQFISSNNKPEVILHTSENPWENEVSENIGFGEFTANFASNEETSPHPGSAEVHKDNDSDDDFGDFDEFKSGHEIKSHTSPPDIPVCGELPVLNFHSSDSENQIIERINKVMHSIFQQEIVEPDRILDNRIESSLGVTWGYLLETDIRQPYIVNWNNSLAQKTLLKALCIDSRNILFGPKWSCNMPKYAANLGTAPLQPQKQPGQLNTFQSETAHHDKVVNKTSWVDPFTSDGQESCSAENDNVVLEAGPTDLDVFEASVATKTDKIYSNTLSIQPIRQINLPDTHIFTPTDSETPRSKTIHYDNRSPAGPIPNSDNLPQQTPSLENDNDYWEFQDFQGTIQSSDLPSIAKEAPKNKVLDTTISKEIPQKSNYNIETQVLQPVKLDLVMPTLNWPNPGEVKETFDDFTDFISNSSLNEEKIDSVLQSANVSTKVVPEAATSTNNALGTTDKLDDDFEMFQSAIPQFQTTSQPVFSTIDKKLMLDNTASTLKATSDSPDFDATFSMADKDIKPENISVSHTRPIEYATKNKDNVSKINEIIFSSPLVQPTSVSISSVLQPTIATTSGTKPNHQKTSQILQPLSLESYSQINWPNPGINLQDLSRFNPVESLQSLKSETNSQSKTASPVHSQKGLSNNQTSDDDMWGEFVSSKPKQQTLPKKATTFTDDDEWTDFVSSPSVNPHNGLNTISFNVHTNSSLQKSNTSKYQPKANEIPLDIPTLNYITPKTTNQTSFNERHFQNL